MSWNHNVHYHDVVLRQVPPECRRALDAGCGRGEFAQKLARQSREVIGIDSDRASLDRARASGGATNVTFMEDDVLRATLRLESFDFIASIATLHHLPLRQALERFRDLLRPGGVLVIVGLYKIATPPDYFVSAIGLPLSLAIRLLRGGKDVAAPVQDPGVTLGTIRQRATTLLPGSVLRRRLFFRYTLIWRKPIGFPIR